MHSCPGCCAIVPVVFAGYAVEGGDLLYEYRCRPHGHLFVVGFQELPLCTCTATGSVGL